MLFVVLRSFGLREGVGCNNEWVLYSRNESFSKFINLETSEMDKLSNFQICSERLIHCFEIFSRQASPLMQCNFRQFPPETP